MLNPFLVSLLSVAAPAGADEDPSPTPLEPAWVMVDRRAWLHEQPQADARRLRVAPLPQAPEHAASPVVVLQRRAQLGDWIQVRTVPMAPVTDPRGAPMSPDLPDPRWPHCYPPPPALGQMALDLWVRASDLLPVLTRSVVVEPDAGGRVVLEEGLLAVGRNGRYRVSSQHLTLVVDLPDDAVDDHWPLDVEPPDHTRWVAYTTEGTSYRIHPTWTTRGRVTADELTLGTAKGEGASITRVQDRCVRIETASPLGPVPQVTREALRAASAAPIRVPRTTAVTRRDGTRLGEVAVGDQVLWTRQDCTWTEGRGLCCDPLPGLEQAGEGDLGLCFDADLSIRVLEMGFKDVLARRQKSMTERTARYVTLDPSVAWATPSVRGTVSAAEVDAGLEVRRERLLTCYQRALQRDPDVEGTLDIRFVLMPDARGRGATRTGGSVDDAGLLECLYLQFNEVVVPNQAGQPSTVVNLQLTLDADG